MEIHGTVNRSEVVTVARLHRDGKVIVTVTGTAGGPGPVIYSRYIYNKEQKCTCAQNVKLSTSRIKTIRLVTSSDSGSPGLVS